MGCVVDGRDGPSLAVTAVDLLLSRNARDLAECGFYYGDELDVVGCHSMLGDMPEGTFLLRDSSHHEFVYALSVNVGGGCVRSIRIGFGVEGRFYLDWCGVEGEDEPDGPPPPTFSSVLSAVSFLIGVSGAGRGVGGGGGCGGGCGAVSYTHLRAHET